jgi:hypothetical protein
MRHLSAGFGLASLLLACGGPAESIAAKPDTFVLRDFINRSWSNELVSFPLSPAQFKQAAAGQALVDSAGRPALYQVTGGETGRIEFLASVEPLGTQTYRLTDSASNLATDLKIEETADTIRLANDRTGVIIRKILKPGEGPFAGFRLGSGAWVGDSSLTGLTVTAWTATIASRGPASARVACEAKTDKGPLTYTIRLDAREPVVLIEEKADIDGAAALTLALNEGFQPDHVFYRRSFQEAGRVTGWVETSPLPPADAAPVFVLEPWLHWQSRVRQGSWFSLYTEREPDMLTVGALNPDLWVDLNRPRETQASPQVFLTQEAGRLVLRFPLKHGYRRWLAGTHDRASSLAVLGEKDLQRCTIPQQSVVKHGNFPLQQIRDYTFTWRDTSPPHPRLLLTPADVAALRAAAVADTNALAASVARALRDPINRFNSGPFIRAFLASDNPELGRRLALSALAAIQECVDDLVRQDRLIALGFAPHHLQSIVTSLGLADAALAGEENFLPGEIERIKAQAAFIAYTLARPDYWSPERGFSANPNMTTSVRGYQVALACLIPSHPLAKAWVEEGLKEMRRQIDDWSDANGGWLEAPHYAMVSFDQILGAFLMARNAGFGDDVFRPKMRKVIEWFGKTATPPDSRIGGFRHKPPVGNTYLREPNGEYGVVAAVWKKRDPAFASELQWLYEQHNRYAEPGIGGGYPALAGFRDLLLDPAIPARPPAYGSELFPETGAVLRNAYPSARETYLYMILGRNHAHYDMDSGSITFWGKGRILADDFGYYGWAPAEDHNLLRSPAAANAGTMRPESFHTSPAADYVRGRSADWTREVLLVKDADPLAPNYVVLADTLATVPTSAVWQLWCTATSVTPRRASGAFVEGLEDVDMEIFFAAPAAPALTTETKTRRSGSGLFPDWHWGPMESTQIGLLAAVAPGTNCLAVLYPHLKTEASPAFESIANGRGVRIRHPAGVDYVFAGRERIAFKDDKVDFEGTVGVVQFRGAKPALFLGDSGRLSAGGQTITFTP